MRTNEMSVEKKRLRVLNGWAQLMVISCGPETTILQLKKQICNRMRVGLGSLSLRCGLVVLSDDESVPYAMDVIPNDSAIHVLVML